MKNYYEITYPNIMQLFRDITPILKGKEMNITELLLALNFPECSRKNLFENLEHLRKIGLLDYKNNNYFFPEIFNHLHNVVEPYYKDMVFKAFLKIKD